MSCKCLSRELWRREASIDQTIQSARDEMTKCERNLRATVGKVCTVVVVLGIFNWFTAGIKKLLQEKGNCECSDCQPTLLACICMLHF